MVVRESAMKPDVTWEWGRYGKHPIDSAKNISDMIAITERAPVMTIHT